MALIRMDAIGTAVQQHGEGSAPGAALKALLMRPGPVTVMVHGYRFQPGDPLHCPHRHIFSASPDSRCHKAQSWPAGLGIGPGRLGVAFGWDARGSIWQAHDRAEIAGAALAQLLREIRRLSPAREVHAIGHSLGARVILSALQDIAPGDLSRVILLAGAEHASVCSAALASPAGQRLRALHVTSGENRAYDIGLRALLPLPATGDRILGEVDLPGLSTLRLDDPAHLAGLAALGHRIAPRQRRVCHWSSYLRPGIFDLYRAICGPGGGGLMGDLKRLTAPAPVPARAPGWSLPLPWGANAS